MNQRVPVMVTLDGDSQLAIDPDSLQLQPGNWVDWQFPQDDPDLPPGLLPVIVFTDHLGPFQYMQVSSDTSVQGLGNTAAHGVGPFSYTAMLLDGTGTARFTGTATIESTSPETNESPVAQVTFDRENRTIKVDNEHLQLFRTSTATWRVTGLPDGYFITFLFDPFPNQAFDPQHAVQTGLFQSLAVTRAFPGDDPEILRVLGVDFTPQLSPLEPCTFAYRVVVRAPDGSVIHTSPDPIIDNLGPPATPPFAFGRLPQGDVARSARRAGPAGDRPSMRDASSPQELG